ncbi:MAG: phage holin family protein [Candidatus Nanopelagicales bacterium]
MSNADNIDVREKQTPSPEQPLSELISNLTEDTSRLFRQEVALARAEIKQEASVAMVGAAMMAMAGALSAVALILLSLAAAEGLQRLFDIDLAWCYFIVAVIWLIVAGVLFSKGKKKIAEVNPKPERTVESIKDVADTLKGQS